MIEFSKKTYVHAVWFFGDVHGDVFAALWCNEEQQWRLDVRTRRNGDGDEDPTSPRNNDRKMVIAAVLHEPVDLAVEFTRAQATMRKLAAIQAHMFGTIVKFEELLIESDGEKASKLLAQKSWVHVYPTAPAGAG